jgi:DNA polymerase-3 subunit delta
MMAQRQVVIIKEAQELADLNKDEGQRLLLSYIKSPLPSTVLVFAHKHKTLDGRKPLAKELDKLTILVESAKIKDYKVPEWIGNYLRDKGLTAKPNTIQLLADYIGSDLSRLANEMDKLSINLKSGQKEITPELVQQYIGISKDFNIFELQKALVARNAFKANQIIQYFESDPKNNPLILNVAALFSFFCKIIMAHQAPDKSERGLAAALKVNPFFVKDYLAAMRTFPLDKTLRIIGHLREADIKSKGIESGNATEGEIMKELVFKILH